MKLEEIQIEHLLPLFMRRDECNLAIAEVADEALRLIAKEIAKLSTFDSLDMLNTAELDELATELNVLWYDRDFTDEQKRIMLLNSDKVYMTLGSRAAVQQVVSDVFGSASIEEFWEAKIDPHYFQIYVNEPGKLSAENEAKLLRMLNYVKRKSQWLKKIYATTLASIPLNIGFHLTFMKQGKPRIDTWQDNSPLAANIGAAVYHRTK